MELDPLFFRVDPERTFFQCAGSDWIRVEVPKESIAPTQAMPYGHAAYECPIGVLDLPEPQYSRASQYSRVPKRYFCGAVFNEDSPDGVLVMPEWSKDTIELFSPIPEGAGHAESGICWFRPR